MCPWVFAQIPSEHPCTNASTHKMRIREAARAVTRAIHFCDRAAARKTKSCATGQRVRQGTAPSGHAQDKPWMGRRASPSPNKMPGFLGLPLRVFAQEVGEQRLKGPGHGPSHNSNGASHNPKGPGHNSKSSGHNSKGPGHNSNGAGHNSLLLLLLLVLLLLLLLLLLLCLLYTSPSPRDSSESRMPSSA